MSNSDGYKCKHKRIVVVVAVFVIVALAAVAVMIVAVAVVVAVVADVLKLPMVLLSLSLLPQMVINKRSDGCKHNAVVVVANAVAIAAVVVKRIQYCCTHS